MGWQKGKAPRTEIARGAFANENASPLERVPQGELNQARIHRCAGDLPESPAVNVRGPGDTAGRRWVVKLWMVERVEEFRSEGQRRVFAKAANLGRFGQRHVPIELSRTE